MHSGIIFYEILFDTENRRKVENVQNSILSYPLRHNLPIPHISVVEMSQIYIDGSETYITAKAWCSEEGNNQRGQQLQTPVQRWKYHPSLVYIELFTKTYTCTYTAG